MAKQFPRTEVGGISLPRMLIGTNWLLGWSHKSFAMDSMIKSRYATAESFMPVLEAYLEYGIDAIMGPISDQQHIADALQICQDKLGKKLIIIDTPVVDVNDTAEGRANALATIKKSAAAGAAFCLPHHSSVEQLVNKNLAVIDRLPDYLAMIRDCNMVPGLSAHMPELITYSDEQGYDVQTYIQIYNCLGFLMQIEIETIAKTIHNAKKPVMTIKSMAAGRVTPYVGLNFSWSTLRECDMVTLGAFMPDEVHEDVEISFAHFERRYPNLEGRSSPNNSQAVLNKG
ncbi:MAG: helicase RepA family protein [Oscillospiraceae bacterium]|nr:helicase RepA family protein [Oscillospiraceae bacterium]